MQYFTVQGSLTRKLAGRSGRRVSAVDLTRGESCESRGHLGKPPTR